MKKSVIATVIIVIALVGGAGLLWWAITNANRQNTSEEVDTATSASVANFTSTKTVSITMRDLSFTPAHIKVKKGTKVTWTNQDTVGHNVVASEATNTGGLPTQQPTFGKGQTYSFTFNEVGTFPYMCTPHPFMRGSVQVVE